MLKNLAIFLAGFVSASALFLLVVVPKEGRDKFQFGFKNGMVEAQFDMGRKIPATLGADLHRADGHKELLSVKDLDVVVVERNGIKTLRVYETPVD